MKKNLKFILCATVSIVIVVCIFCYDEDNIKYAKQDEVIQNVLSYKIEDFSDKKQDSIKEDTNKIINETKDKEIIGESYYILGFLSSLQKNEDEAIKFYNKAIENIKNIDIIMQINYELSRLYLIKDEAEKSNQYFENMKEIGLKSNKEDKVIEYSLKRGLDIYSRPHEKNEVVKINEYALELAKKINYDKIQDVYFNLGRSYWSENRVIDSINTKLEALSIATQKGLDYDVAYISTDLGIDYLYSGNYEQALVYLLKTLETDLDNEQEDAKIKSYSLMNIFEAYINLNDFENAQKTYDEINKQLSRQDESKYKEDYITYGYVNRADMETQLGNLEKAKGLLDNAKSRYEKRNKFSFYDFDVRLKEEYGDLYYKYGEYKLALEYHKEAWNLINKRGLTYLKENYSEKLYLDYKALGDYENTIKYLENTNNLKIKSYEDKTRQYYQYLHNEFEDNKKINTISKLEYTTKRDKSISLILIVGAAMIVMFCLSIYDRNEEIKRLNRLFKRLSMTDSLTNIPNRRALEEFLEENWNLYKDTKVAVSFVMIDIDYFKLYNDNYGHLQGDEILKSVSKVIRSLYSNDSFVARYGGEEFIIVTLNSNKDGTIQKIERLMNKINELNIKHEYSLVSDRLTISVGATVTNIDSTKSYLQGIKKSDCALYESKRNGRNRYTFTK